jgi:hypothetical protein
MRRIELERATPHRTGGYRYERNTEHVDGHCVIHSFPLKVYRHSNEECRICQENFLLHTAAWYVGASPGENYRYVMRLR